LAELNTAAGSGGKKRRRVKRPKKLSTRVDLTPMVDLGFLLITFFIFTTTMSRPKAMHIILPKDVPDKDRQLQPESAVLTLMPAAGNQLFYYEGSDPSKIESVPFNKIREVIRNKQIRTNNSNFMIILKPTSDASYKNTVDMLDEMTINQVRKYAMVDISPAEYQLVLEKERDIK
jgi:biopolymer transport protein ExbD